MQKKLLGVNKNILSLGIVSLLTDISSEMIFSVFSIFFTVILGASAALLGLIEGLADFSASSLDYIAGYLSDRSGKRKKYAILGYGFSALAKAILLISNTIIIASFFRVIERLGKSFRGPPRDAWIASFTTMKDRGYSFGVHKTLDKAGAIIGPLIAYWIIDSFGQSQQTFTLIFQIALVPAVLAIVVLFFLKEKPEKPSKRENIFKAYASTSKDFKSYLFAASIFSLAYFSFSFLLLKAYIVGFAIKEVVLLYALFNLAFIFSAAPIGKLGDIIGRKKIILLGYILYLIMSVGFIFSSQKIHMVILFVLFGIFYAIDESQSKAYISDVEKKKRGTAIGLYNFSVGIIYLPASLIAGLLWAVKPEYAFMFAAAISVAAAGYFMVSSKQQLRQEQ